MSIINLDDRRHTHFHPVQLELTMTPLSAVRMSLKNPNTPSTTETDKDLKSQDYQKFHQWIWPLIKYDKVTRRDCGPSLNRIYSKDTDNTKTIKMGETKKSSYIEHWITNTTNDTFYDRRKFTQEQNCIDQIDNPTRKATRNTHKGKWTSSKNSWLAYKETTKYDWQLSKNTKCIV